MFRHIFLIAASVIGFVACLLWLNVILADFLSQDHPLYPDVGVAEGLRAAASKDEPWNEAYWREFAAADLGKKYDPYVAWRMRDFQGEHLNIQNNIRLSTQMLNADTATMSVAFFGGSTMYGTGARDAHTIPSAFATVAAENGRRLRVVNYGQPGWNSTQELLALREVLLNNEKPRVVIFYDGWNDMITQVDNGPERIGQYSHFFVQAMSDKVERGYSVWAMFKHNNLARRFMAKPKWSDLAMRIDQLPASPAEVARATSRIYAENVALLHSIAKQHGIQIYFFWQPALYTRQPPHPLDPDPIELDGEGPIAVYHILCDAVPTDVVNLCKLFNDVKEPLYIDTIHPNEKGNRKVAEAMYRHLQNQHTFL